MEARLERLSFARYRAFRDQQVVSLGRLNLLYGENNAGKSALLRLPAILQASRGPGEPGLTLPVAMQRASLRDIQWQGPLATNEDPDLVLGVGMSSGLDWQWTLRRSPLDATVSLAEVRVGDHCFTEPTETDAFDGLLPPVGVKGLERPRVDLTQALHGVIWLAAHRDSPPREGAPRGAPGGSWWRSSDLAARQVAADPRLRAAVSRWYEQHAGVRIEVETLGRDLERLTLAPKRAAFAVPFPDAGEGLQAVFGVLVALEHLRERGGMLCVEEPGSHMHPRLQQRLAEHLVEVLAARPTASVMLETHSEILLVAALTAAARSAEQGGLPPETVKLHWVEVDEQGAARVEPIGLDELGRPTSDRLEQAFSVMGAMRRDLIKARRARGG